MADKWKAQDILPVGTMVSGYAKPSLGPFKCSNCMHRDVGPPFHCQHPMVESDRQIPKDNVGHTLVDPEGCCTYFRKG